MEKDKTKQKRIPYTSARRKEWKKAAKKMLIKHYVVLVAVALLGGLLGVESGYNPNTSNLSSARNFEVVDRQKAANSEYRGMAEKASKYSGVSDSILSGKTIEYLMLGKIGKGAKDALKEKNALEQSPNDGSIMGRRGGILAGIANDISSGSLVFKLADGIRSIVRNGKVAGAIVILLFLGAYFLIWYFLINTYKVTMHRVFLEARTYDKVPVGHFLFLKNVGKIRNTSRAMFRKWLYEALWTLTVVGGIIKYYSYWCVPYILAENPGMSGKEAIALSRKMMNGRKWETFKYDVTFFGWDLLAVCTVGILTVLFVTPYKRCADSQMYAYIREESIKAHIEGTENLKDIFLFEKTDPEVLEIKYGDILYRKSLARQAEVRLTGIRFFLCKYLGVWVGSREEQLRYEAVDAEEAAIERAELAAKGITYPERYNPLWTKHAEELSSGKNNYLKPYSIWSLIIIFAIFAFAGWAWEVGIHVVKDGVFINRGVNHGPWLPIYGAGGVMILMLLNRFRKNPAILGCASVVLCGLVEYFTSYFLEMSKGIRWWDYTGYFLNLNGRICAEGLTVFAIGGMAAVYIIAPALDARINKISPKIVIPFCVIFSLLFVGDLIYSHNHPNMGEGITDYDNYQEVEVPDEQTVDEAAYCGYTDVG